MLPIAINNKYLITSINNNYKFIFLLLILIFYFAWMDIALFINLQRWSPPLPVKNQTNLVKSSANDEVFSVFKPLSVKLIMVDHVNHYIHDIFTRFLEDQLHFTSIFPWITPNLISYFGLAISLVSARLIISDDLFYCRIGIVLFEIRNMCDSLDGVVYRSQLRQKNNTKVVFQSNYGSYGYNVDKFCDGFAGIFFVLAMFIKFLKHLPHKREFCL